jgi:hypothetical protein
MLGSAEHSQAGLGKGPAERVGDGIPSGIPRVGADGMRGRGGRRDGAPGARCGGEQPACQGQYGESDQQQRRGAAAWPDVTRMPGLLPWALTMPPTVRPAAGLLPLGGMLSSPGR